MEGHDISGLLIGDPQSVAGGVDGEAAGNFAARGDVFELLERSAFWIDGVDGEAVVAAVGGVEEFSVGVDFDFGSVIVGGEVPRQG